MVTAAQYIGQLYAALAQGHPFGEAVQRAGARDRLAASVGATYVYDKQSFDQTIDIDGGPATYIMPITLTHDGVGIPLSAGIGK